MTLVIEEQVRLQRPRISTVIPAGNEAQNLAHVVSYIPSIVNKAIQVDEHSTDDTIRWRSGHSCLTYRSFSKSILFPIVCLWRNDTWLSNARVCYEL